MWEEVYKNAKRADRSKNDLHERDDGELERTAQPLSIYEPYFGEGAWPFLHNTSLYRGLGLVSHNYYYYHRYYFLFGTLIMSQKGKWHYQFEIEGVLYSLHL